MPTQLQHILLNVYKEDMVAYMENHPEDFDELVELATAKSKYTARAAWLIGLCMKNDDQRVHAHMSEIIQAMPKLEDNERRNLYVVLQKMTLNEDIEGEVLSICLDDWEKINKKPAVRLNAFKLMVKIAKNYPELKPEIELFSRDEYLEGFSDGVIKAVFKLVKSL